MKAAINESKRAHRQHRHTIQSQINFPTCASDKHTQQQKKRVLEPFHIKTYEIHPVTAKKNCLFFSNKYKRELSLCCVGF